MQGIAHITARADSVAPGRNTKVNDSTFETIMSKQGVRDSEHLPAEGAEAVGKSEVSGGKKELTANRYRKDGSVSANNGSADQKVNEPSTYQSPEDAGMNPEEAAEIIAQTMIILQEMFGLTEVDLQDIMNQLSMEPQDLLLQVDGDVIVPVNTGAIQELILGIHGIEDAATFLTNDSLNQELTAVTEQITEILSENLGVAEQGLDTLEPSMLSNFAEQLEQAEEFADVSTIQMESMTSGVEEDDVTPAQNLEEPLTVVVEAQESAGESTGESESRDSGRALTEEQSAPQKAQEISAPQVSTTEVFKENLAQAFEDVRGTEGRSPENVMRQIVEQVVRHVRIRVMPETTSMELQLNPASLGRVNLTVATTAGVATATMVVENQMAKEALESQMIQLKETFNEQGMKVDAVEVTVAEFGLKKENEQQEAPSGEKRQNKRAHSDDNGSEEEESVTENVTVSERRDVNSVVDYTA